MEITIKLPEDATLGDITTVQGVIFEASASFVDWDALAERRAEGGAISAPGRILLAIGHQLGKPTRR